MEQRLCWPKAGEAIEVHPSQDLRTAG